jgi:hypothetical protein
MNNPAATVPPIAAGASIRLLEKNPFQRIRHIPGQPVTYLQNPKVATKSIELSLWRKHDPAGAPENPHAVRDGPFIRHVRDLTDQSRDSLMASRFFSVVRNPYSRFLSAYLNKVMGRPWEKISVRMGFTPDTKPTVHDFLAALRDRDPYEIDHHFRLQHINLLRGFAPLDMLGYFEALDDVRAFLNEQGFTLESNLKNSTGASSRVNELLDAQAVNAIQAIYEMDFQSFCYSPDPAQTSPLTFAKVDAGKERGRFDAYLKRKASHPGLKRI